MNQTIEVPLRVGARVVLYEDASLDGMGGGSYTVTFEDTVEQYCADTALLEFEDSDAGMANFKRLAREADGVEIINNYE